MGDVHFDFLFGVAAVNTGRIPEGLLALERHLSAVPDSDNTTGTRPDPHTAVERGARVLTRDQVLKAMHEFGLLTRYVKAIGIEEDGIWVHSILPGKSGGVPVTELNLGPERIYVEYLPIDWAGQDEIPDDIDVLDSRS